jgi:hypothetical protein
MPRSSSACTRASALLCALLNSRSQSLSRSRISPAALRVKVIATISCGAAPSSSARRMRDTSIQVLPAPAQASTTTLRPGSQATR